MMEKYSKPITSAIFALTLLVVACTEEEVRESRTDAISSTSAQFAGSSSREPNGLVRVNAETFHELGALLAYENAKTHYCDMTALYLYLAGEQSAYLGATPERLEADFAAQADRGDFEAVWATGGNYADDERAFIEGFADGYNAFADEARDNSETARCNKELETKTSIEDFRLDVITLTRHKSFFTCAVSYDSEIYAASRPVGTEQSEVARDANETSFRQASMNWAFGGDITENGRGILLAQPHDGWVPYYPSVLEVEGAMSMIATFYSPASPSIYSWTNGDVASSITCHHGQPYIVYELPVDEGEVTIGGRKEAIQTESVKVHAVAEAGEIVVHERVFQRTSLGPSIALDRLQTEDDSVLVLHDVSANRPDISYLPLHPEIRRTTTAEDLLQAYIAAERNESFQHAFADRAGGIASAPNDVVINLPKEQWSRCTARDSVGAPGDRDMLPILDGSRADCLLASGQETLTAGVISRSDVPAFSSRRALMGSNQGAYLLDPENLSEGYSPFIDGFDMQPGNIRYRSRGRMLTHRALLEQRQNGADGYSGTKWTAKIALERFLDSEGHWSSVLKDDVVDACEVEETLQQACSVLRTWDGRIRAQSRGAILWRTFWLSLITEGPETKMLLEGLPDIFEVRPDPKHPYTTPRGLSPTGKQYVRDALRSTIAIFEDQDIALDISVEEGQRMIAFGAEATITGCSYPDGCQNLQVSYWKNPWDGDGAILTLGKSDTAGLGGAITLTYEFTGSGVLFRFGGNAIEMWQYLLSDGDYVVEDWSAGQFFAEELCAPGMTCDISQ